MKVYLRAFEYEDFKLIYKWNMDDKRTYNTAGNRSYYSSERVKKWVEGKITNNIYEHYLAICLCANDKMIGYISLRDIDYVNRNAFWGGILIGEYDCRNIVNTVQAVYLLLEYGFYELGLHKIYGKWMKDNKPSLLLGDIFGFQLDGVLRDEVYKNGQYHDLVVKSIMRSEYQNIRSSIMKNYKIETAAGSMGCREHED